MPYPDLDAIDRRILAELQRDGRMTNQDLSERVGLSPSPCLRRLRQLEAEGVIARYVALIDPVMVGLPVTAFIRVRLHQQDDHHLARFEAAVAGFAEVMECYLMTGDSDYLLRVVVPDLEAYERFVMDFTKIVGIAQIRISFALRAVKQGTALPVR